jgi:hypothetical protein
LPNLSPNLFGDGVTTGGRWLYGNWLDWEQLNDSLKNAMFQDVKRLIAIRHKYSHLIHGYRMKEAIMPYATMEYSSEELLPMPYYYQDEQRIILVAANPHIDRAVTVTFDFSQVLSTDKNQVTVLFGNKTVKQQQEFSIHELNQTQWIIEKDQTAQGGVLILEIQKG